MKPGFEFENSGMKLVFLAFYNKGTHNAGIFRCG